MKKDFISCLIRLNKDARRSCFGVMVIVFKFLFHCYHSMDILPNDGKDLNA